MRKIAKLLGFFAIMAIIGFSVMSCKDDTDNGNAPNICNDCSKVIHECICIPVQNPVASDFIIGNLMQTAGSVTAVTIIPKSGKSNGTIKIFYDGATTLPETEGSYNVTFNVAASTGWSAVNGLNGGTLTINNQIHAQTPIITSQPVSTSVTFNTSHDLSVTVSVNDDGELTYQWYISNSTSNNNGIFINNATSDFYNPPTNIEGTFYYFVEITNSIPDNGDGGYKTATIRSEVAILTVDSQIHAQIPSITSQPTDGTVIFNETHSLSVTASSPDSGTLTYQWYSNTTASNVGGTVISGAVSATYNPLISTVGTFYYFVQVTNTISDNGDGGAKTATARSNAVTLTVNTRVNAQSPIVSNQPLDTTITISTSHSFSVTAYSPDSGTLTYQWYSNTSSSNTGGTAISGAISAAYNPPTSTAGTFYYFVQVTNTISDNGDGGYKTATARSNAVTLTVNARVNAQQPNITGQPTDGTFIFNGTHSLSVTASSPDSGTLTYQWYSNTSASNVGGTVISGAASANYNPPTSTAGTYYYFVQVTNTISDNGDGGSKTATARSNAVTLTVNLPTLTGTVSITGTAQAGQTLTANTNSLGGSGSITYQWKRGTTNIGTNSSIYTIQTADTGSTITVTVTRSDNSGSVTSTPTTTIILPHLTGTVSITGTARVGQILTANTSSLGGSGTITYQWKRGTINIGTNSSTYTIQAADAGSSITVTVTRLGNSGSVTSESTAVITIFIFTLINNNTEYSVSRGASVDTEVVIPSVYNGLPVTQIASQGFQNYSSMTSIIIPNSVKSIGNSAFYGCTGITSVTIGNNVTSIGSDAFLGCTGLTSITVPDSVTSIGSGAFYNCTGLKSINIPNSVTSINRTTFLGCSSLTSITIPNSVTSIGISAFYNCTGLTSITIPSSVTSIGDMAFYGCTGIVNITIPNSVTSIGEYVFDGRGLTNLSITWNYNPALRGYNFRESLKTVIISSSVTSIGNSAFYGCTGITSVTIGNNVTSIGSDAFLGCTGLTSITVPDSVTSIGSGAFTGCTGLTSITIPDSVTSFDSSSAFSGCTGLTSIKFPNSVTSIGSYAFSGCTGLTSITIPDSVTSISFGAFAGCTNLSITWNYNPALTASNFKEYLKTVIISNSVTSISSSAFSGCTGLTSITIPDSVTSVGSNAFSGCTNLSITWNYNPVLTASNFKEYLRTVIISNSVTSVGSDAFSGCTNLSITWNYNPALTASNFKEYLKTVIISSSVTSISTAAFLDCIGLTSITIPNSVTSIGGSAFFGCTGLTSITIPNSVTSITTTAFAGGASLTSITVGANMNFYTGDANLPYGFITVYDNGGKLAGTYTRPNTSSTVWTRQ